MGYMATIIILLSGMTKKDYKILCKQQKDEIKELNDQLSTLRKRLDTLRKAKNQTVLKTEIINRQISEPQFGLTPLSDDIEKEQRIIKQISEPKPLPAVTYDKSVNTEPLNEKPETPSPEPPKRFQRIRRKESWSQCKIYTDNKFSQASFVQTCHCEGVFETPPSPSPPMTPLKSKPVTPAKTTREKTPKSAHPAPVSRMKTNEFIAVEAHLSEIKVLESVFKTERDKMKKVHEKEILTFKQTVESLSAALKQAMEQNAQKNSSGHLFHMYAEEKNRLDAQITHLNKENTKFRDKISKLEKTLQEKEAEWEENEEAIKQHYVETWDSQYRAWMNKTDTKMNFIRNSNEIMQNFIMKNAKHLPFGAAGDLQIFNEYGEKMSVFQ